MVRTLEDEFEQREHLRPRAVSFAQACGVAARRALEFCPQPARRVQAVARAIDRQLSASSNLRDSANSNTCHQPHYHHRRRALRFRQIHLGCWRRYGPSAWISTSAALPHALAQDARDLRHRAQRDLRMASSNRAGCPSVTGVSFPAATAGVAPPLVAPARHLRTTEPSRLLPTRRVPRRRRSAGTATEVRQQPADGR